MPKQLSFALSTPVTIIPIALCADSMPGRARFSSQNTSSNLILTDSQPLHALIYCHSETHRITLVQQIGKTNDASYRSALGGLDILQAWHSMRPYSDVKSFSANQNMCLVSALDQRVTSTQEGVEMISDIRAGDRVRLLSMPDWLTADLPVLEQLEMRSLIGQTAVVSEVDAYGYFWLGFGGISEASDVAHYSGHSFGVPRESIELCS
jgi:hypothetical protein